MVTLVIIASILMVTVPIFVVLSQNIKRDEARVIDLAFVESPEEKTVKDGTHTTVDEWRERIGIKKLVILGLGGIIGGTSRLIITRIGEAVVKANHLFGF